jgi:hypothetical protein
LPTPSPLGAWAHTHKLHKVPKRQQPRAIRPIRVTTNCGTRALGLDEIAEARRDAAIIDEPEILWRLAKDMAAPARSVAAYRHRLTKERKRLVRKRVEELIGAIDVSLGELTSRYDRGPDQLDADESWQNLVAMVAEV